MIGNDPILRYTQWMFIGISLVGFVDASYLTAMHYIGGSIFCFVVEGCDAVAASPYATPVWGIPLALIGVVYYAALFIAGLVYRESRAQSALRAILLLSSAGFAASVYFVYLQIFVIRAICFYCMVSALCSLLLFLTAFFLQYLDKKSKKA